MAQRRIVLTRDQVTEALEKSGHDVMVAAQALGVSYRTLYRRMDEFGIRGRSVTRYEPVGTEAS